MGNSTDGFGEAATVMAAADVVVLVLGTDREIEREGRDRVAIGLPGVQRDLAAVAVASGKPVVAVLINGGPMDVSYLKANVDGIMEAWSPGEQGGNGVADVLFGDSSPSGAVFVPCGLGGGGAGIWEVRAWPSAADTHTRRCRLRVCVWCVCVGGAASQRC